MISGLADSYFLRVFALISKEQEPFISHKTQVHKKGDQELKKTTYDLAYGYGETQPHAPIHIGDQTYT